MAFFINASGPSAETSTVEDYQPPGVTKHQHEDLQFGSCGVLNATIASSSSDHSKSTTGVNKLSFMLSFIMLPPSAQYLL